jgi:hypothetical protein
VFAKDPLLQSTSTNNKTTKVKMPRENRFCVFLLLFCLNFVLWWVFFYAFVKFNFFNHQKCNYFIQIMHNRIFFITQRETLLQSWFFFVFVINLEKPNEEEKIFLKKLHIIK